VVVRLFPLTVKRTAAHTRIIQINTIDLTFYTKCVNVLYGLLTCCAFTLSWLCELVCFSQRGACSKIQNKKSKEAEIEIPWNSIPAGLLFILSFPHQASSFSLPTATTTQLSVGAEG
jgi:hypothetical protein